MSRPSAKYPTELELEILKVLWAAGPLPGKEIRDALAVDRELTYQSVMTVLSIMEEKGYVTRKKQGPTYCYRAKVTHQGTTRRMMRDVVDRLFNGSAASAMLNLLETSDVSDEELDSLIEHVKRLKKG